MNPLPNSQSKIAISAWPESEEPQQNGIHYSSFPAKELYEKNDWKKNVISFLSSPIAKIGLGILTTLGIVLVASYRKNQNIEEKASLLSSAFATTSTAASSQIFEEYLLQIIDHSC